MNLDLIKQGAELILDGLGVDKTDENFKDTPNRFVKVFKELCSGMDNEVEIDALFKKTFPSTHEEMVFVGPISTVSVCPHHLLPVISEIFMAYLPKNRVIGLSKLPRLAEMLARRPVLQEQLTSEIADKLFEKLDAQGCGVLMKSRHLCMEIRGVRQQNAVTTTVAVRGCFKEISSVKQEFLDLVKMNLKGG